MSGAHVGHLPTVVQRVLAEVVSRDEGVTVPDLLDRLGKTAPDVVTLERSGLAWCEELPPGTGREAQARWHRTQRSTGAKFPASPAERLLHLEHALHDLSDQADLILEALCETRDALGADLQLAALGKLVQDLVEEHYPSAG